MLRRAEIRTACVVLQQRVPGAQPSIETCRSRFTGKQHHLAFTVLAFDHRRKSNSSSSSRPTSALGRSRGEHRNGFPPTRPQRCPCTHRPGDTFEVLRPKITSSNRLPSSFRVPSAMTTLFGSAIPCKRAAMFGVSPTMPAPATRPNRSDRRRPPVPSQCRHASAGARVSSDHSPWYQLQPRAHGALSVVLVGLGIPKVDQDTIAHVLRNEPAEVLHSLRDALLVAEITSRRSSGSMRADRAVEPTKSENITVTWRRSAVSCAFGSMLAAGSGAALVVSAVIAASIFRRGPSGTPMSFKS